MQLKPEKKKNRKRDQSMDGSFFLLCQVKGQSVGTSVLKEEKAAAGSMILQGYRRCAAVGEVIMGPVAAKL